LGDSKRLPGHQAVGYKGKIIRVTSYRVSVLFTQRSHVLYVNKYIIKRQLEDGKGIISHVNEYTYLAVRITKDGNYEPELMIELIENEQL